MEKQMKAERERREAILRAEGEKKSTILVAEGKRNPQFWKQRQKSSLQSCAQKHIKKR